MNLAKLCTQRQLKALRADPATLEAARKVAPGCTVVVHTGTLLVAQNSEGHWLAACQPLRNATPETITFKATRA